MISWNKWDMNVMAKVMSDIPMNVCLKWHRTTQSLQLIFLFECSKCLFTNPEIIYNVFVHTVELPSGTSREDRSLDYATSYLPAYPRLLPALLGPMTLLPSNLQPFPEKLVRLRHTWAPQQSAVHPAKLCILCSALRIRSMEDLCLKIYPSLYIKRHGKWLWLPAGSDIT